MAVAMTVEQLWQPVPGGSGTYIRELAAALAARGDVTLTGIRARPSDPHASPPTPSCAQGVQRPESPNPGPVIDLPAVMQLHSSRLPRPALYESWLRLRRPRVPGPRPDVIHATTWAVPPRSAPLVVTVHDLAFQRSPDHFTPRGVAFFNRALEITRREADVVIVPSQATRDDVVAAGIDPERVRVIPHGVAAPPVTEAGAATFRERHGLLRPYVMWCGAIEPRKNLGTLLAAFSRIVGDADLDLVLAGPDGWGGAAADLGRRRAALPADRVHVLGALSWADLHAAYTGARVFAFPSLWEGFGMPVLEAQAHGVPVVTSRGTSMAEVLGGGGLLVDASDDADLAASILAAAGERHDVLSLAARVNAARYTWPASAEAHLAAYRDAAEGNTL